MLFPTTDFAVFFGFVYLGHWLLQPYPRRWKVFMVAASYVFYGWWDWRFVLLLGACTLITQGGTVLVARSRVERGRRLILGATVAADLGLLVWFKYYGFLAVNVANALRAVGLSSPVPLLQVALPVGVSFFTFMAISYVVDVYRRQLEPAGWLDAAAYLSFFPHLVAGPIVRGHELLPQIRRRRDPRRVELPEAAYRIFAGLFKKVVVSSYLATAIVDPVFANPRAHSSVEVLLAVYAYAVQIYMDFSGYTDMAIGIALLMGFRFPENFDRPYTARSLQDFWRRWHITLSRWLRDYLYIPLGGSRGSRRKTYRNVMLTMLIGGLWHGAAWTFVAWGGLLGLGLVIGRWRRERRLARGLPALAEGRWGVLRQRAFTFNYICVAWVFFRADTFGLARDLLGRLFTAPGPSPLVTPMLLLVVALGIGLQYAPADLPRRIQTAMGAVRPAVLGVLLGAALFGITILGPQGVAPFIYFRF